LIQNSVLLFVFFSLRIQAEVWNKASFFGHYFLWMIAMLSEEDDFSYMKFNQTIVLVGLMGAGKTSIGRRLAKFLGLQFYDSDREVEKAAGCTVASIYEQWGEQAFREVERKVIRRLLSYPPHILSTGDGAFVDEEIRSWVKENAISIWLKSDEKTLYNRLKNSRTRPQLLEGDPEDLLRVMIEERSPIYAMADLCIPSEDKTYDDMVAQIVTPLMEYIQTRPASPFSL